MSCGFHGGALCTVFDTSDGSSIKHSINVNTGFVPFKEPFKLSMFETVCFRKRKPFYP